MTPKKRNTGRKAKKIKPVKAWALLENGEIAPAFLWSQRSSAEAVRRIYPTFYLKCDIIRVEIRPVRRKKCPK